MRTWVKGTDEGDWVSMGVPSDGSYGIKEGIIYSFPVQCINGIYKIIENLDINSFSQKKMDATEKELHEERSAIASLL